MKRLQLTLAYDGTAYCGWQIQAGRSDQPTIQGELEKVLTRLCGETVRAHGSGRTDAGVHALEQVVHVDIPDSKTQITFRRALNALLPDDIACISARIVPDAFHSRYSALSKTYAYTLWLENAFLLPQRRAFVWKTGPLNMQAMQSAAALFCGEHDFCSFQNVGTPVKSTVRNLTALRFDPGQTAHECVVRLSANGFLKQQVRNMLGLLVAIGRGQYEPEIVERALAAQDRRAIAYQTAPAQGLCLEHVEYPALDTL